ncbi:MAG TPA: hypothetical protein VGP25_13650 [Gemmatimonadaceae bacterium]|jgi:hypothetical protein|nr:hypothetical protein [Gemmatimonadaceae bacterium]
MQFTRVLFLALFAATAGCGADALVAPPPTAELQAAPASIVVEGQTLVLRPELWRDFMPITPPNGKPLAAVLRLYAASGTPVTASFHVDAAWVVNGADMWAPSVEENPFARWNPQYYEVVAHDGPKWDPGILVDVVVRVREASGATQLLRAAAQRIQTTN